ncbi:hypothetical protein PVAP13_1NG465419 [Panicum virgatum]|uniref:Secreted protein n=1 Tax=Panicum virgatum TaxID=38727 RepID=A0A8T0X2C0_PANVG|nr:hypothetical protein PVAP13_1NG465419 [Panicum virgatum]
MLALAQATIHFLFFFFPPSRACGRSSADEIKRGKLRVPKEHPPSTTKSWCISSAILVTTPIGPPYVKASTTTDVASHL